MALGLLRCVVCGASAYYQGLHEHLVAKHPELVEVRGAPHASYAVECPVCHERYEQRIKRGSAAESFLTEFERDVRLVGGDILLQHLIGEHAALVIESGDEKEADDHG